MRLLRSVVNRGLVKGEMVTSVKRITNVAINDTMPLASIDGIDGIEPWRSKGCSAAGHRRNTQPAGR
jgi:hypothetical protein